MSDAAKHQRAKPKTKEGTGQPSNADLAALIGRDGLTIVGAVSFLLSLLANANAERFASIPLTLGYLGVTVVCVCGFIVVGGLNAPPAQAVARLILLLVVSGVFSTPPLFSIWDSARQRAPQEATRGIHDTSPSSPRAPNTARRPFQLEITP